MASIEVTDQTTLGVACRGCPLVGRCTTSPRGRTVRLHEGDALQREHRARATDDAFQATSRTHRPMVERSIAWLARRSRPARALPRRRQEQRPGVGCHEHGTAVGGFLPVVWEHLFCESWDHPGRLAGGSWTCSLTARVMTVDVEVNADVRSAGDDDRPTMAANRARCGPSTRWSAGGRRTRLRRASRRSPLRRPRSCAPRQRRSSPSRGGPRHGSSR